LTDDPFRFVKGFPPLFFSPSFFFSPLGSRTARWVPLKPFGENPLTGRAFPLFSQPVTGVSPPSSLNVFSFQRRLPLPGVEKRDSKMPHDYVSLLASFFFDFPFFQSPFSHQVFFDI